MALPSTKVEIAFNAGFTTPAASRTWTDVSTYVEAQSAINITRGRTDQGSVPPGRLTLTLNNRDARFTPEKTTGAYYPNVKLGRPIRITVTYNAVNYVRFVGFIDAWTPGWPDGTDSVAVTTVTASSRLARLGRDAELRSIIEEEILLDSPAGYYTLGEPAGSTSAADSSNNLASSLTMTGSGADVTFGTATGPGTDGLTAATFSGGKYLVVSPTSSPAMVEFWFTTTAINVALFGDPTSGSPTATGLYIGSSGELRWSLFVPVGAPAVNDGLLHHVAFSANRVIVDGVTYTPAVTAFAGSPVAFGMYGAIIAGSALAPFVGTIAHAVLYSSVLSAARITAHYQAGATGFAGELSGSRIARYAGYAGVPATEISVDTGLATIGHVDTTDQAPVDLMRRVEKTEGGVLYDAKDGTLTFKDRDTRYNAAAAFTLSATSQEIEADLNPDYDDTYVLNDVTAIANGTPAGRVTDTTSTGDLGYYRDTFDSVTNSADDAYSGAAWLVGTRKDPRTHYNPVTVDVVNSSTSQAAAVMTAEIGTRFDLSGLPSQALASTAALFVEGYTERITSAFHNVAFNTSPTFGYTGSGSDGVWQLQVAGRSELGDTTRLAF